jgi:hypothetical protein
MEKAARRYKQNVSANNIKHKIVGGPVTWSWEKIKTNLSPKNIST